MARFVMKGRLFAQAILFLVSVLWADTAAALVVKRDDWGAGIFILALSYFLGLVFSVKVVTAVIGRYQQNQPVRKRRFGVVLISAVCCMIIALLTSIMHYYQRDPNIDVFLYDISPSLIKILPTFPVLLFLGWLYVYKPRLKSWSFAAVGVVAFSALGLLYQWNEDAVIAVMIYIGIVFSSYYAGKEL